MYLDRVEEIKDLVDCFASALNQARKALSELENYISKEEYGKLSEKLDDLIEEFNKLVEI